MARLELPGEGEETGRLFQLAPHVSGPAPPSALVTKSMSAAVFEPPGPSSVPSSAQAVRP